MTESNAKTLADQVVQYLDRTHTSIQELADRIDYSRSTLSRYLSGKYDTAASELEGRLAEFLAAHGQAPAPEAQEAPQQVRLAIPARRGGGLYQSLDAQRIVGLCSTCQEDGLLGLITGKPGYGKTYALQSYAKMPKVLYLECDETMGQKDFVGALERRLGIPRHGSSVCARTDAMVDFFRAAPGYLLIVDEADKLISKSTIKKMEILRKLYDRAGLGIVIAGEPILEVLIRNFDGRFANRLDMRVELQGLTSADVDGYVDGYDMTPEALAELKVRAYAKSTSCFRLLNRTLNNVDRLLAQRGETTVTLPMIREASAMMLL